MIPLRLDLRNFLCYRENVPTLDFTGIHLACLCGPNGHGKSALLDAITWCLWGKARARSQDALISFGAEECRVQLDFSSRAETYRVIRSHIKGGGRRQQGATDLQLQSLSGGDPVALTGNTIRESQAKIDRTVGMDYETFINSAFLLQGRADEFTNKPPADRKAVLAKVLSLETYDLLQSRARERLSRVTGDGQELSGRLAEMRRQADDIGDPTEEIAEADRSLSLVNQGLELHRQEADGLRVRLTQMEASKQRLNAIRAQMEALGQDLEHLGSEEKAIAARIEQFQLIAAQEGPVREGIVRLARARDDLDEMEQACQRFDHLLRQRAPLDLAIQEARTRLEGRIQTLQDRVEVELPKKTQEEPELLRGLAELDRWLVGLARQRQEVAESRERSQALATQVGEAKSTALRYESEGKELNAKLALLQNGEAGGEVCPLCQSSLDQDSCLRLADSYRDQVGEKRGLYRQNRDLRARLEKELADLEKELSQQEQAWADDQRRADASRQDLERRIQESRQAQTELESSGRDLLALRKTLDEGTYAESEQVKLKQLDLEIRKLGYDESVRQSLYQQTRELQPFEEQARRLDEALESLPGAEGLLVRTREMLERRQAELRRLDLERQTELEALTQLPGLEAKLREADEAVAGLEARRESAVARRGYLQGQLNRRKELLADIEEGSARLRSIEDDQVTFQELVSALGRQGVQAMLIETVVPQLEEQTNLLLGRITDNRMHVKLETQRERRTGRGEPIETLEINVNDELGPRGYEMYSGGEAFRVNLALRIALSKVLAQRVGAPLPTLFIDEGFGTQDASGRECILDALGAIQNDFEKIIVITHLEDMKEAFPVRIEVQKDSHGSTFWLN